MLKAGVQMWFESQLDYDRIVVTVDVCIDTIEPLKYVADERRESFGERYANA